MPWFWMPGTPEPPPDFQMSADELEALNLHGLTPAQVYWRRNKINSELDGDEARFMEEYPATPDEAFRAAKRDVFIQPNSVLKARRYLVPDESEAPLIVAMDPARFGPDSSAFAWRRGRLASKFVRKSKWDTMALAGLAVNIIKADSPAAFFIDVIGLGAGVYDRLIELGYSGKVIAVNGAENATEDERYHNKRAECWGRMKEWLNSGAVQIPDSDALAQDLLRPGFKYDSRGRVLLESKDDIRAKGDPSPDLGDALAMTFAEFVATPAPGSMYGGAVTVGDRTAGY